MNLSSWGRILAATGSLSTLSVPLDPSRVSVSFVPTDGTPILPLLVNGEPEKVDEGRAKQILTKTDLELRIELGLGAEAAKYWTCDFSYVCASQFLLKSHFPDHMGRNMYGSMVIIGVRRGSISLVDKH